MPNANTSGKSSIHSPRRVYDDSGEIIEVILDYQDYRLLLKKLADEIDWEKLPSHLQDAVDAILIEEAESEDGEDKPLRDLLQDTRGQSVE